MDVLAEAPFPFQGVASHTPLDRELLPGPGMTPVQLFGAHVSVDLFMVLGVQAATGRTLPARRPRGYRRVAANRRRT